MILSIFLFLLFLLIIAGGLMVLLIAALGVGLFVSLGVISAVLDIGLLKALILLILIVIVIGGVLLIL